jgi:toxin CcdB
MAQYDVYKNPRGGVYPLLLDVQSDVLSRLERRIVVPLVARKKYGAKPISKLNPLVMIGGVEYVLVFQDLAAIPAAALGERVESLANRRADLVGAIDLLFTGI